MTSFKGFSILLLYFTILFYFILALGAIFLAEANHFSNLIEAHPSNISVKLF